jgi:hypothetical protein
MSHALNRLLGRVYRSRPQQVLPVQLPNVKGLAAFANRTRHQRFIINIQSNWQIPY